MTTYTTPDGYLLTYDPSLDAWTDGDLEFSTEQLVEDLEDLLEESKTCSSRKGIRRDIEKLKSAGKFESLDDIRRAHESRIPSKPSYGSAWKGYLSEGLGGFFKGSGTFDGIHGVTHIETTFYPKVYGGRLFITREEQCSEDGTFQRVDFMVYEARPCGEIELHWRAPSKERAIEGALETVESYANGYSIDKPEYLWGYMSENDMLFLADIR